VSPSERQQLRELYDFHCGYCGVSEVEVGSDLTCDHFQPTSQGGADTLDNYVYCCHGCNSFKNATWQDDPNSQERILHPLRDNLAEHVYLNAEGILVGLTETGRFHIEVLRLNRPASILRRLRLAGMESDRVRLVALESEVEQVSQQLNFLLNVVQDTEDIKLDDVL
jgi:HNH endonuclease